jgi:O-antigen ligase
MPAFCLACMVPGMRWYIRLGLLAFVALNLYQTVVVNSLWVSGWVPTVLGIGIAIMLWSWKAVVGFGILSIPTWPTIYEFIRRVTDDNVQEGGLERLGIWELSWSVVSQHWLFGTGPAGYAPYNMTYFPYDARSTHNNYLDILGQFGFMGMITWLIVGVVGVFEGLRLWRGLPPGFLRTVVIIATSGWIAAQGAMFFGDWVLPFAYNQTITGFKYTVYTWIFLGMLISVRGIASRQAAAAREPVGETVASP